jgi:branched-chain amino acid aminotransferase
VKVCFYHGVAGRVQKDGSLDKATKIWYNCEMVAWDSATVHLLTHALHYGTAIFEGLRCYKTDQGPVVFRLYNHVWRLINSAKIYLMNLGYEADDIA